MTDTKNTIRQLDEVVERFRFAEPIHVTRPSMPAIESYIEKLRPIWETKWLTNNGAYHVELERRLTEYLGVSQTSLFCNGTIAMMVALMALRISDGEVITTPFTFPATSHVLWWNRVTPVFCDIEPHTFNMNPDCIERLISQQTKAIMPVHVYGNPCDVKAIEEIADRYGLRVIYDAAHAMGVRYEGKSLLEWGDLSTLSFHATKLFSTIEGGAVVSRTEKEKKRVDFLKNFGIADEENVIGPGINGKMNEFQAAYGLLQLDTIGDEIASRQKVAYAYRRGLANTPGITYIDDIEGVDHNYAYFPVIVDEAAFGMNRDELHRILKTMNIITRKYFYPLCSKFPCYVALPSASPSNLPVAELASERVLCLPIYGSLEPAVVSEICAAINELHRLSTVSESAGVSA